MRTPSRSAVGRAAAAIAAPVRARQTSCTRASVVAGASVASRAARARPRAGAGRLSSCRERLLQDRAGGDAQARHVRIGGAGHVARGRSSRSRSARRRRARRRAARGARRRARSSRRRAASAACALRCSASTARSASSSASRARRCSPWEPYTRSSRPSRSERELVAVRAVPGESAFEVRRQPRLQLGDELVGVGCARARPVLERRVARSGRAARRARANGSREQLDGRRRDARAPSARLPPAHGPTRRASRRRRARSGFARAARCAVRARASTRGGRLRAAARSR